MLRLRAIVAIVVAVCGLTVIAANAAVPANPYNAELAGLETQVSRAAPPEIAVLLARAYRLRDYIDSPEQVLELLRRVAYDPRQHPLVRDEAGRYLADADLQANDFAAAEKKLSELGFVRQWQIAGPFAAPQGLDAQYGPERGFGPGDSFQDAAGRRRTWRVLPLGPSGWVNLADLYPSSGPSVAFAASAIYSETQQAVALRFSADTAVAVFVNGHEVFVHRDSPKLAPNDPVFDQNAAGVRLRAGWNSVVLKLARSGDGPWRFALRVTTPLGGGVALPVSAAQVVEPTAEMPATFAVADLVDIAKAAAEANPGSASALATLGLIEQEHARGKGLEHLEAAARRGPSARRWLDVAANCGDAVCKFNAASEALRLEAANARARVALANYYTARGQLHKARNLLREAVNLAPGDFVARNGLLDLYVSQGLDREALDGSARLEQEFPHVLWLKRKIASRYFDAGLLDRAQALLTAVLRQDYTAVRERAMLAQLYERRRDVASLRATYEEMTRLDPTDPAPLAKLAALDGGAGNLAAAGERMQAAPNIAPENGELRERQSLLLANPQESRPELVRAVDVKPQLEAARRRLQTDETDRETQYLEDPAALAAAAHREPPATTGYAVVLAEVRVEHVADSGLSTVREQQLYYLATDQAAREFRTRSVQYAPGTQDLRILHARVYKADGRVLEGEESGESSVAETNIAMYYDVRSRGVRYPALERGDVIELDYRITPTTNVNAYGDYFGGLVAFRSSLAQQLQRFVLITPARRRFNILEQRMAPAVVTEDGGHRIYRWEARSQEALPNEPHAPALTDVAPYVHVSTFQSWEDLGRWYAQLIEPQFALDATLRDAAARLVKNARTERDRITAIHQFVLRNTHYVALEFGTYSYKPYPVSQVYARRFGDCKDKASLMIALLRQAGIDAEIALVRTRSLGEIGPRATSISVFNHAIVYVPKYDLWLDGTAEYAGSQELPLDDQGATALTVAVDGRATLRQIPMTGANDNYTRRTVRAQVMTDGRIQFSGVFYTRGEDAPGLRRDYETPERRRDILRNTLAKVFPSVRVDDVRVEDNDLEQPVTVEFRGTLDTFVGRKSVPLGSSWMPRNYLANLAQAATRQQELRLRASWTTEEELHFALPAEAVVKSMPSNTALETPFGSATLRYERVGNEVVVRTSVQFRKWRIAPEEYTAFRNFCQQVERAFRNEIKLSLR
ncbi:MAG: DUF3857 domain-containing protein [Terriglobales bacterium]